MAYLTLLLVFVLLGVIDAAAALVAIGRIGTAELPPMTAAVFLHGLVAVLAAAAVSLHPLSCRRPGARTLALLAAFICLLTPVLGCIVAAWLVCPPFRSFRKGSRFSDVRLGNPLTESLGSERPNISPPLEPLATALRHGHAPLQQLAVPRIRPIPDRRALAILRDLNLQPDPRTHLYAQAALSTGFERRERRIAALRQAVADSGGDGDSLSRLERLGTALIHEAELNPEFPRSLWEQAGSCYERALAIDPADAACLLGRAICLIRLGDLDAVPDLYGRLCAVPGAGRLADRLELDYFAAAGNWKRTAETIRRQSGEHPPTDLGQASRQFWLTTPSASG